MKALGKLVDFAAKNSEFDDTDSEYSVNTNRKKEVKLLVNAENNFALFDQIICQLQKPVYGLQSFVSFKNNLISRKEKFMGLSVFEQAKVLLECVKILKCNAENPNITALEGGARAGILTPRLAA